MRYRQLVHAVAAMACLAGSARAQDVVDPRTPANDSAVAVTPRTARVASTIDRPSDAVRRKASAAAPLPATGQNLGEAKAEMAVGAAAIILGAIIDGDAGAVLMFGGAIVGLYGLWNYLK